MSSAPKKNPREFHFDIPGRYLLLIVTVFCAGLIALTYYTDFITAPVNRFAGYLVVPFQNGISEVGQWFVDRQELARDMASLREENKRLREENSALVRENTALLQDHFELDELRSLYALDSRYASYEMTAARIIARDSGNWYHSFIINKGTDDGLLEDMNVLSGTGLVGRITSIGPDWARVNSIIDDNSNVSGCIMATGSNLNVSGDLTLYQSGEISFEKLVDPEDTVDVGAAVVTSNISDKYLPGILIGHISSISKDPNNLTKSGRLTPAVNFDRLDTVLIIKQLKETVGKE